MPTHFVTSPKGKGEKEKDVILSNYADDSFPTKGGKRWRIFFSNSSQNSAPHRRRKKRKKGRAFVRPPWLERCQSVGRGLVERGGEGERRGRQGHFFQRRNAKERGRGKTGLFPRAAQDQPGEQRKKRRGWLLKKRMGGIWNYREGRRVVTAGAAHDRKNVAGGGGEKKKIHRFRR